MDDRMTTSQCDDAMAAREHTPDAGLDRRACAGIGGTGRYDELASCGRPRRQGEALSKAVMDDGGTCTAIFATNGSDRPSPRTANEP